MRLALSCLLLAAALLAPHAARACPGADAPCRLSGDFGAGEYRLALPEGPGPHPAVMSLHGWGGRADRLIAGERLAGAFLARGYAVIAPQGAPRRAGDTGGAWNAMADPARRDDVAFLRAVAQDAARRAPLDRERMLAAGFSGGGMMVWRLACDAPRSFAAYAPLSGLLWRPLPDRCAGPVRLLHAHGWSDRVVPMEGRAVADGRLVQGDLFAGLALLRAAGGCRSDAPDAHDRQGPLLIRRWTDCAPGADLSLAVFPGGHGPPEGWAEMVANWFESLPPGRP